MTDTPNYRVGEFADLAGVTVRTLHFYDEAGLLKPSRRTNSEHRLYRQEDLLRLQQILTLKHLGFSLQEIQALLENPAYDVREALRIQKQAVDQQILELQIVSYALSRTLEALETLREIDWSQVARVIRSFSEADRGEWLRRHYPPEQWAWIHERAVQMPPDFVTESAKVWENLFANFRAKSHLPPDHPDVQSLAAEMNRLVEMFTGGDAEIERSVAGMYSDWSQVPNAWRVPQQDEALHKFANQALTIYRQKGATG